MAKLIYRNTPYTYPQSNPSGVVTLDDAVMQSWNIDQWKAVLASYVPDPVPFAPTFRLAFGQTPGYDPWVLNHEYFASAETAQWISNKYGAGEHYVEVPFGGAGGIFTASANEYHIKLKDGRLVNAGIIAAFYERNPEERFPGLADRMIRKALGLV